jgi:hypothetical protein
MLCWESFFSGPPFFDISILLLGLYNIAQSFWYGWGGSGDSKRAPSRLKSGSGLFHINLFKLAATLPQRSLAISLGIVASLLYADTFTTSLRFLSTQPRAKKTQKAHSLEPAMKKTLRWSIHDIALASLDHPSLHEACKKFAKQQPAFAGEETI